MHFLAGGVGVGDQGIGGADALEAEQVQQQGIQPRPRPPAGDGGAEIDRQLHVPLIGGPGEQGVGVGVAHRAALLLQDQIGQPPALHVRHAAGKLRLVGQVIFKGDGGGDVCPIDVQQGGRVLGDGKARGEAHSRTRSMPSTAAWTRASTSSFSSAAWTSPGRGRRRGCRGVKTVQQSS